MALSITADLATNLFRGLTAVYLDGQSVSLYDSVGAPSIGTAQPVAPTVTQQPTILPDEAAMGDSVTLNIGAASGSPAPVADWDITRDGVSLRAQLDVGAMTFELSEPGTYILSVRWSNAGGTVRAISAQLTVEPVAVAEIDYNAVTLAYLDAGTAYGGTAADVTSISAGGTAGYVFTKAGSGAAVTRSAAGFVFSEGAYVQTQVLSSQPTTDGMFAVADITLASYGTSAGQILDGAGTGLKLRNNAGALQVIGPVSGQGGLSLGNVSYGTRMILAGQLDDLLDLLSGFNTAGGVVSVAHAGLVDPAPTRFITGRYINGTLHRMAIVGRPEGADWPITMQEVVQDFRRGV